MTDRASGEERPELTVVIVARNAAVTIGACLDSLRRQASARKFEVFLIDSSSDGTATLVEREFPEVRLVRFSERKYCGDGRNIGVTMATAPVVAFLDADCVATSDWAERVCLAHEHPYPAVGGAIDNREPSSLTGWAAYFCEFSQWMPGTAAQWMGDMAGANLSYKADVLRAFGPFIEGTYCSDTEFHWRLAAAGHAIRFEPSIRVSHIYLGGPLTYLLHEFTHGKSFARVRVAAGGFPRWRRLGYSAGFIAVAATSLSRITLRVLAARSYLPRFLIASPLVAAGVLLWSLGESAGYLSRTAR